MKNLLFSTLYKIASTTLQTAEAGENTQVIVLRTQAGKLYHALIADACTIERADERALIARLEADGETCVTDLLCVWQNGTVDLPSYAFRTMLLEANPDNQSTEIFVNCGWRGYATVKLKNRMK